MGQGQQAVRQPGQGHSSRGGFGDEFGKGHEDQRNQRQRHVLGVGAPDEDFNQVKWNIHVGDRRHQPRHRAVQPAHKNVHPQPRPDRRQHVHGFDGRGQAQPHQKQQFGGVKRERRVQIKQGIAIPKGKVGRPARPPEAIAKGLVKLDQKENAVPGVVGLEEVGRGQQRSPGKNRERQD